MKKIICIGFALTLLSMPSFAQKKDKGTKIEPCKFETIIEIPITSIKNQASSGTCWCFSGIPFFKSEIMRATGGGGNLSESL